MLILTAPPLVPLALATGIIAPVFVGWLYGDALGAFVWASLVKSLLGKCSPHAFHVDILD